MKITIIGTEPQFKVYKMHESVENKFYIGKTKKPLTERMQTHRTGRLSADIHFGNVGWNNVSVEIIDVANNDEELAKKEEEHIIKNIKENFKNILNMHRIFVFNGKESLSTRGVKSKAYHYFNELQYAE